MSYALEISALSDREIAMKRTFDAPRQMVFDAWTRPELLQQWLGVRGGWTMPVCEIDLRVGGAYRYVWAKEGTRMVCRGVYREIDAPALLVNTETFDDPWYAGEALVTLSLEEIEGGTETTMTMLFESTESRDHVLASPMESGVAESYAVLDELLLTLGAEQSAATE